ncbi:MAGI1 protein, partial [Polypterus senegalus]
MSKAAVKKHHWRSKVQESFVPLGVPSGELGVAIGGGADYGEFPFVTTTQGGGPSLGDLILEIGGTPVMGLTLGDVRGVLNSCPHPVRIKTVSQADSLLPHKISKIQKGSPADRSDRLKVGDRLEGVDGHSILTMPHRDIVELFRKAGNSIRLRIIPHSSTNSSSLSESTDVEGDCRGHRSQRSRSKDSRYYTVDLERGPTGFGFSLRGGSEYNMGLYVLGLMEGGPASRSRKIQISDQLVEINGENTAGMTHTQAVEQIRRGGSRIHLVLKKGNGYVPHYGPDKKGDLSSTAKSGLIRGIQFKIQQGVASIAHHAGIASSSNKHCSKTPPELRRGDSNQPWQSPAENHCEGKELKKKKKGQSATAEPNISASNVEPDWWRQWDCLQSRLKEKGTSCTLKEDPRDILSDNSKEKEAYCVLGRNLENDRDVGLFANIEKDRKQKDWRPMKRDEFGEKLGGHKDGNEGAIKQSRNRDESCLEDRVEDRVREKRERSGDRRQDSRERTGDRHKYKSRDRDEAWEEPDEHGRGDPDGDGFQEVGRSRPCSRNLDYKNGGQKPGDPSDKSKMEVQQEITNRHTTRKSANKQYNTSALQAAKLEAPPQLDTSSQYAIKDKTPINAQSPLLSDQQDSVACVSILEETWNEQPSEKAELKPGLGCLGRQISMVSPVQNEMGGSMEEGEAQARKTMLPGPWLVPSKEKLLEVLGSNRLK